jgi:flagellar FliL protein
MAAASMTVPAGQAGTRGPVAADGGAAAKPKGTRKPLVVVAVVAVLAAAGLAYPKLTHKPAKSFKSVAAAVPDGPIESLDPVTVNLADGHLLQVGVAVQLTKAADAKKVTAMDPRILDAVITTFSGLTYPVLLGTPGHEQARQLLQTRLQGLFPPVAGTPQVAGVYFTSFVMQ